MKIAVTGGTGFIGRYVLQQLAGEGHKLRCWHRSSSDRNGFDDINHQLTWIEGELGSGGETDFVNGCDAVVHVALFHPGGGFQGRQENLVDFVETNVVGTIKLIEAAKDAGVKRFVFVSTCAVHDEILDDRPLDETHPLWMKSHYGAHKAAIEKFVHSYGLGENFPICAVRPTGVYGVNHPVEKSKWFDLVQKIVQGESVTAENGGKEVHAADVAKAISVLLDADEEKIRGQAFNCYDRYISRYDVATLAKQISESDASIHGEQTRPLNQIETGKIKELGMSFGGDDLLKQTVQQLVSAAQSNQ